MANKDISDEVLRSVTSILVDSSKTHAERQKVVSEKLTNKYNNQIARPLDQAQAAAGANEVRAKDGRIFDSIMSVYSNSVKKEQVERQARADYMNKQYEKIGGTKPIDEQTKPKTDKEKKLAAMADPKDKITHKDVMVARGVIAKEEVEEIDEISNKTLGSYVKKASVDMANRSSDATAKRTMSGADYAYNISRGMSAKTADAHMKKDREAAQPDVKKAVQRFRGIEKAVGRLAKEEAEIEEGKYVPDDVHINPAEKFAKEKAASHNAAVEKAKQMAKQRMNKEETDTPGNSYQHQCAVHVKHAKLGEGRTLTTQHADVDDNGNIEWYDVMFEHGIERVPTIDLEILMSESHMHAKRKKGMK